MSAFFVMVSAFSYEKPTLAPSVLALSTVLCPSNTSSPNDHPVAAGTPLRGVKQVICAAWNGLHRLGRLALAPLLTCRHEQGLTETHLLEHIISHASPSLRRVSPP